MRCAGFQDNVAAPRAGVDVVVHSSSHAEPFGRVVVEGMLSGWLLVATSGRGVNEIVPDGSTGLLVLPNEPRLLTDTAFAGPAWTPPAAKRFGIDQTCRDMAAVLKESADIPQNSAFASMQKPNICICAT